MKALALLTAFLAFTVCASAAQQSYFFHHASTPVAVPGGTSSFFLDDTAPGGTVPTTVGGPSHRNSTLTLPTFIGRPFASDTTLMDPCATVEVFLSAGGALNDCVDLLALIERVDAGGSRSPLVCETVTGVSLPRGIGGGASGFHPFTLAIPIASGTVIHTGESVAVTVSVVNNCRADRPVNLAYDATVAPSQVSFGTCGIPFGGDDAGCVPDSRDHLKCAENLAKLFAKTIDAVTKCHRKQADALVKGDATANSDEETCEESDPVHHASAKEKLEAAIGDIGAKGICSSTQLTGAMLEESALLGYLEAKDGDVYCDPTSGSMIGDDDAGFVPNNHDALRCADAVGKGIGKLMGRVLRCHAKAPHSMFAGVSFSEEGCEETDADSALAKFDHLRDALASNGSCPACLDSAHLDTLASNGISFLDTANDLIFPCEANATAGTCP